jgi:hypothetical protein
MVNPMVIKNLLGHFLILVAILTLFGSAGTTKNAFADTTDDALNTNLISAAFSGNLSEVDRLLKKGANVNAKRQDGITALMGASIEGHIEMVEFLLAKGADINAAAANVYGRNSTACSLAFQARHLDIVELLIKAGASFREPEVTSPAGRADCESLKRYCPDCCSSVTGEFY